MILRQLYKHTNKYSTILFNQQTIRLIHLPIEKQLSKTLVELLDMSETKIRDLFEKYPSLKRATIENVKHSHKMLINFGIDQKQITEEPQLIGLLPITIENRCLLLQECGFTKITNQILIRYLFTVKKHVALLKSYGFLPNNANVSENIYNYLEKPPINVPVIPTFDDKCTLYEIFNAVREHYIIWRLEFPDRESYLALVKSYSRMKYRSFRNVKQTIKLLENDIGLKKNQIRNNGYLLHSNPNNTKRILTEVSEIGGLPIRDVLCKYPKIIMTNVNTLKEILEIFQNYNIPNESIRKSYIVFTLSSNSVLQRLRELKQIPELNVLRNNKRILKLINYQNKAKQRLEYLRTINMHNASLHILSTSDAEFKRYVLNGADKTRGNDIINYLKDQLNDTSNDLRSTLIRHPFWFNIPLIQISETCKFLCKTYKAEDIKEAAQILLYPREKVEVELQNIRNSEEYKRKWLSPVQELNLCLYYLEKPFHFSGDGVWKNENN